MATRKAPQGAPIETGELVDPFAVDDELPIALQIEAELNKYDPAEEISFKIFRITAGQHVSKAKYVATLTREEFSEDRLQQSPFNGGDFRVWILGKNGMKRNFGLSVETLPENAKTTPPSDTTATQAMMTMLMAGFQETNRNIAQAIAGMKTAQPAGMGIQDTISLIASLSGMMAPKANAIDPMALVTQVFALAKGLQPEPGLPKNENGETDMMGGVVEIVKSFAPVVKDMVNQRAAQTAPNAQPLAALSAPVSIAAQPTQNANVLIAPVTPIQSEPTPEQLEQDDMFALKMIVPMIKLAAKSNADVTSYVDAVLNMAPDTVIAKYIDAPDWFEQLCGVDAEFVQYKEWLTKLRDAILADLQD